jgi:hypothetical protein
LLENIHVRAVIIDLVDPTEGMHKTGDEEEPSQGNLQEM